MKNGGELARLIELLTVALESGAVTVKITISLDTPTSRQQYLAVCPHCGWTRRYSWETSMDKGLRAHIQRVHGVARHHSEQNGRSAQ